MTRKSQARLERDNKSKQEKELNELFKTKSTWDELEDLYASSMVCLANSARIIPILRDQRVLGAVEDLDQLTAQAALVAKDTQQFREQLQEIRNRHANRKGQHITADDLVEAITIGEAYNSWFASYNSVVAPNVTAILLAADRALAKLEPNQTPATEPKEVVADEQP